MSVDAESFSLKKHARHGESPVMCKSAFRFRFIAFWDGFRFQKKSLKTQNL